MRLLAAFRFELDYQLRRVSTWLYFVVLGVVSFLFIGGNYVPEARRGGFFLDAPFVIAQATTISCLLWVLVAAGVAGEAAARDVESRMHPLAYTAPVRKAEYLGGRFLAAFVLNALILLAVPLGILLAMRMSGVEAELLGPFRPAAYLGAYAILAVPNAFVVTAIQFAFAALGRRAVAAYLGGVLLLLATSIVPGMVAGPLGLPELGKLLDPVGVTLLGTIADAWTPAEKNTRLVGLEGTLLWNRLLWTGIGVATLALTYLRFRFAHHGAAPWWSRLRRRRGAPAPAPAAGGIVRDAPIIVPDVPRSFGFATHARQALAIAWTSFRRIATSRGGVLLLALVGILAFLAASEPMQHLGVPLLPRADRVLNGLTVPEIGPLPWVLIPLLIVFWAGELVWREREAGLGEIVGSEPVPEWVLFLGRFLGLALVLAACMALRMAAGMLLQVGMGHPDVDVGLYLQVLFGLELVDYLLLGLLALAVHVVVNQRQIGHLVTLVAFVLIAVASLRAVGPELLVYGSDPGWSYTDMRGFGGSLGPLLWFKLYWAAWALLLAVVAGLFWVRGREGDPGVRLHLARRRFTRRPAWAAAAAAALILTSGGFIFYNTSVLDGRDSESERMERLAEYERRYGRYAGLPQPRLTGTTLRVEIHPDRRSAEIRGTYHLVNATPAPIDTIHLATAPEVETGAVTFDRPAARVPGGEDLDHQVYALAEPLQPGDSLRLSFEVRFESEGFGNRGADAPVVANGTYFTSRDWLPALGYQPGRQIGNAADRRAHGLPERPAPPARRPVRAGDERIAFDAVVGTDADQVAVAPGTLRREWTEGGRRYFHYSTDAPIRNRYAFFSADYAVREARWNDVAIRIFHDPGHTAHLDRMVRGVTASLDHYTRQFGPYPYRQITLVERPGHGLGLHAEATLIDYEEGFSLLDPDVRKGGDLPFYLVAREVARQWWGAAQLVPAGAPGAPLLLESVVSYSAFQVVENTYGPGHLRWFLDQLRAPEETPRPRAAAPLLRASDAFLGERKGPLALHALGRYVGEERVNQALRSLLEKHRSGAPPLATSVDLYRELRAVTPDSLRPLLRDLFEANTFWELATERATARRAGSGAWEVTLQVRARKVTVDREGVETVVPMDDWLEIAVFAPARAGKTGDPLYRRMHRIRSGQQTITVTVPRQPARAAIDPDHLLTDAEVEDDAAQVTIER